MTNLNRERWDGTADYLIIGGGGGGSGRHAGGGGAGGYKTSWAGDGSELSGGTPGTLKTALTLSKGTAYSITVGRGGRFGIDGYRDAGSTTGVSKGNDTSISGADITTVSVDGGGFGAGNNDESNSAADAQGGSSGGAGANSGATAHSLTDQGHAGGASGDPDGGNPYVGGGGGGAGGVGQSGYNAGSGTLVGGLPRTSSITGASVARAGGGGGGQYQSGATWSGLGGGGGAGNGTMASGNGTYAGDALAHTGSGGGGGGGDYAAGGNGASGIAIIRLPKEANYSALQLIEDLSPATNCTASYLNTQVYTDDPNFEDVSLLIRGDTQTDLSSNAHTLTFTGATANDTSPVKFSTGSLYFDGSGDYITVPDAAAPDNTWDDWTIEFWFNSAASGYQMFFGTIPSNGDVTFSAIHGYKNTDNKVYFTVSDGVQELYFATTSAVSTGTWYHYAATRQGNTVRFFLDGVLQSSQTFSASLYNPTNPFRIGRSGNYTNNNAYNYNGNIEDFRITKGVARYTAAFTPPTASLPDPVTSTGGDHVISFTITDASGGNISSGSGTSATNRGSSDGTITWTPFKDPTILDGSTASRAGTSAAQLLEDYPSLANQDGIYWINKNGTPTQIYCDMTTDGGGWMLYSSFASTNTLDATNYPAWNGNQILYPDAISTYGYAPIGAGITDRHDGVNTFGYTHYSGRLGVFYSSGPQGGIGATTWYGPSDVTELRIDWGQGASNYASGTNYIHINGSQVASMSGGSNTVGQYSFNPAGSSSPYFGVIENGIVGIGYVYMR